MKIKLSTIILSALAVIAGLASFFIFQCRQNWCVALRRPIENLIKYQSIYAPCDKPITYTLGRFDNQFGLSKQSFLSAVKDAEAIWERSINRELFTNTPNGDLQINLIYDYRQQATNKLKSLGIVVEENQASYNELKARYDTLNKTYLQTKADYNTRVASFNQKQDAYNQTIQYWNKQGGAPKTEYELLQAEGAALQAELADIKKLESSMNEYVDEINSLVVVLNRLAAALNLNVGKYNTITVSRGEEFTEGDYQNNNGEQKIDIYEFSNRDKLVRVLAHELGHALGLPHIDDPKAIMYKLNISNNEKLTKSDLDQLKMRCGI